MFIGLGFLMGVVLGILFISIQYLTKDSDSSRMERIRKRKEDDQWYDNMMKRSAEMLLK